MYSIIPDRVLAFPSLLFTYLPMASEHDVDFTHVFSLLASDLESFASLSFILLFPSITMYHYNFSGPAYLTNQTLLYKYMSLSHTAMADRVSGSITAITVTHY